MAFRQLALRLQLRADETDGHDPVLHSCPQQAATCAVARALVLEHHLAEPCQGIPDMRRVVDRQTTSATRIDVCKGAVGKLRTLLRAERWHRRMIARTHTQNRRPTRSPDGRPELVAVHPTQPVDDEAREEQTPVGTGHRSKVLLAERALQAAMLAATWTSSTASFILSCSRRVRWADDARPPHGSGGIDARRKRTMSLVSCTPMPGPAVRANMSVPW